MNDACVRCPLVRSGSQRHDGAPRKRQTVRLKFLDLLRHELGSLARSSTDLAAVQQVAD